MDNENSKTLSNRRKRSVTGVQNLNLAEHGRIPPQAVELEEAVLGAIMLEKDALANIIELIRPEAFYKESHQTIYKAIIQLFARNEPVDILTVANEIRSMGEMDNAGGPLYIAQLTNRVASSANSEFHARIILQKFIQRELIRISSEIIHDAYEDTTDVFELLDRSENQLFNVSETNLRRNYIDMATLVRSAVSQIENAKDASGLLSQRGVPSGFTEIDRITSGWQPSDLIVIAARPGMGKTAFVLTVARNVAVDHNRPVAIFSLEMSSVQLVTRLISAETQLSADMLKKGQLADHHWTQLNTLITPLLNAPLYIDDSPSLSVFELRAKCRRLKARHDIQLIIIDYIQLMTGGVEKTGGNREQEISNISRSLKSLAKELDVPVIALSQLNRSVEARTSKKPILSDLRESGAIEQDADMVLFIYRPDYYQHDVDDDGKSMKGVAEISIAKHRNGALGDVHLKFIKHYAKFEDLEKPGSFDPLNPNAGFDNNYSYTMPSKMNDMDDDTVEF